MGSYLTWGALISVGFTGGGSLSSSLRFSITPLGETESILRLVVKLRLGYIFILPRWVTPGSLNILVLGKVFFFFSDAGEPGN